jgi:hypothetical protein
MILGSCGMPMSMTCSPLSPSATNAVSPFTATAQAFPGVLTEPMILGRAGSLTSATWNPLKAFAR